MASPISISTLSRLQRFPKRPIYCAVREYQGGLRGPLEDLGFEWVGSQALLARHTLARVREEQEQPVRGMKKHPEAAVPTALPYGADGSSGG